MKFRTEYILSFLSPAPADLKFPITIELEGKVFKIPGLNEDAQSAKAFVEGQVNRDTLTIEIEPDLPDGKKPRRGISFPEKTDFGHFLGKLVNLLSFLIDIPIRYSHKLGGDHLIPEGPEDEKRLDALGTKQVHTELSITVGVRSVQWSTISEKMIESLARKEVGLALYAQALTDQDPVSKYRDLWKVLESAFNAKNEDLMRLLAEYGPAKELGFIFAELRELLVLRGRSSHAKSRSGIQELRHVILETGKRISRLKCLVEQVIVTKKSWGIKSLGVERLTPLSSYIDSDGTLVLFKTGENN